MDKEELEEERRLCYVGITRAKEHVYITHANKRLFFGTRTHNTVSRFVAEIPESVLDYHASLGYDRVFEEDNLLI
jgi:DNA helicase II / ATP-dependent DNA helicase PcrA